MVRGCRGIRVEVRGLAKAVLPFCHVGPKSSGHQSWWQVPLPAKPPNWYKDWDFCASPNPFVLFLKSTPFRSGELVS